MRLQADTKISIKVARRKWAQEMLDEKGAGRAHRFTNAPNLPRQEETAKHTHPQESADAAAEPWRRQWLAESHDLDESFRALEVVRAFRLRALPRVDNAFSPTWAMHWPAPLAK